MADEVDRGSPGSVMYRLFVNVWAITGLVWMGAIVAALSNTLTSIVQSMKVNDHNNDAGGDNLNTKEADKKNDTQEFEVHNM